MTKIESLPFFISIPHSGEEFPETVPWLNKLSEPHLMRDVDRYVDKLYENVIRAQELVHVKTSCHRYVVDLNRTEKDFDRDAVLGAENESGSHPKGLHWSVTTQGEPLIVEPMSMELHHELVQKYYIPFHNSVADCIGAMKKGWGVAYQLDAHSMPSKGTRFHSDPGQERAEIVVSDFHGESCSDQYKNLVIGSYQEAGFEVAYNWPYVGGGITQRYGAPKNQVHTIQVELNRKLYMDEENKQILKGGFEETQGKLSVAVEKIMAGLSEVVKK